MILDIVNADSGYKIEELLKLWYAELKVLHHAVMQEGYKKGQEKRYDIG